MDGVLVEAPHPPGRAGHVRVDVVLGVHPAGAAVTGPYRHEQSADFLLASGRVQLEHSGGRLDITVLRGEAEVALSEKFDDVVTTFGSDRPIRYVNPRKTVRLVIEATLDQMVIHTDPEPE